MSGSAKVHRTRKLIVGLGVLVLLFSLVALGVFTTSERLIELGPMRKSLCSEIPSVKRIAHLEVLLFRVLCFFGAALTAVGVLMWKRIYGSSFVRRINAHEIEHSSIRNAAIAPFNASFVVMIVCLVLAGLYTRWGPYVFSSDLHYIVTMEDGVVEWGQTLIFLQCSIFFAVLSFRVFGLRSYALMYRVFAVVFFLMAGEEISWGQRILSISTPDALMGINVQDEINLHNLFGYFADHVFVVSVLTYGFLFPVLARVSPFFCKLFDRIGLPLPTLGLALGFLIVSMVHEWTVNRIYPARIPILHTAELRELLTAVAFGLLAYEACRLSEVRKCTQAAASNGHPNQKIKPPLG